MVLVEEKAMVLEEEDEDEHEVEKDLVMSLQELLLLILHQQKKPKQHVEKKLYLQPLYICILVSLPLLHLVLLVNFDSSKKNRIKFADGKAMLAEGVGNLMIKMSGVFYVPGLESNLLSLGQLVEKGHKVIMEDKKT